MAISVDWPSRVITIPKADMTLIATTPNEVRELDVNTLRKTLKDLEDDEIGMPWVNTHVHTPPTISGGSTLARVVTLINGYRITFENLLYIVNVVGGNSNVGNVTNKNQVSVNTDNSAGLVELNLQLLDEIKRLVETIAVLRHTGTGTTFFVSPSTGNDQFAGLTIGTPLRTFAAAHAAAVSGRHDTIFLTDDSGTGQTVLNETWTITKNNILVRGPGADIFRLRPTSTTAPTILVNAAGVEVANIGVETAASGGQNAVTVGTLGHDYRMIDLDVIAASGNGVEVLHTMLNAHDVISKCMMHDCLLDGVKLNPGGAVQIVDCHVHDCATGVEVMGMGQVHSQMLDSFVQKCGTGLKVAAGTVGFTARNLTLHQNTTDVTDNGTSTKISVADTAPREGDVRRQVVKATVINSVRKVAVGRVDHVVLDVRMPGSSDWTSLIQTDTLYAWYETLGDFNPEKYGENG